MNDGLLTYPKAILHTHLEGSVPSEALRLLSQRNNIPLSFVPSSGKILNMIETHNWNSFRKVYFEICSCFKLSIDFFESLLSYGKKLRSKNVIYAEIQFSPWKHMSRGVSLATISEGLIDAIEDLEANHKITIRIITDLIRHRNEDCDSILDWLKDTPRKYFVALGISGGIDAVERSKYKTYCERAREIGLKITSHAGEIEDYKSIREVIDYWDTDRIGHGIRCIDNRELLDEVIEKQIHFEICPTANRIIGLCGSNYNPIRDIIAAGVNFSVNTDDELVFNTDILTEFNILIKEGIVSAHDVEMIQENALENSFLEEKHRNDLLQEYFGGS